MSNLKKMVRSRMQKTGETWQTASRVVKAQVAPERAGFTTADLLFFRPFQAVMIGANETTIPVVGEIRGTQYVLRVRGESIAIDAKILHDKQGPVATLREGGFTLSDGYVVEIELESEPPVADGFEPDLNGMIRIYREGRVREELLEAASQHVGAVNFVGPMAEHYTIHFRADGTPEI